MARWNHGGRPSFLLLECIWMVPVVTVLGTSSQDLYVYLTTAPTPNSPIYEPIRFSRGAESSDDDLPYTAFRGIKYGEWKGEEAWETTFKVPVVSHFLWRQAARQAGSWLALGLTTIRRCLASLYKATLHSSQISF